MCRIFDDHDIWGDIVASYEEYGKGRPALGFTTTISMAETVAKLFQNAGYDFRVIHGGMSVKERSELINLLRTGAIAGLVNAELLTYGFDCPCVSYAFPADISNHAHYGFRLLVVFFVSVKGKRMRSLLTMEIVFQNFRSPLVVCQF